MVISDIDYSEELTEVSLVEGGRKKNTTSDWSSLLKPLLQSLTIYPASAASVNNVGGTSIGNTAISFNISMPIMIALNGLGSSSGRWDRLSTR